MRTNERLRIIETNFGQECGWYVEVDGRKIARLSDPQWEDQFWFSYRLEPLTDDSKDRALLYSGEFWDSCKAIFRNCEFNVVAPFAFAGGLSDELATRLRETGRISMRGLYLKVPEYSWDGLFFWLRRRFQKHRSAGPLANT